MNLYEEPWIMSVIFISGAEGTTSVNNCIRNEYTKCSSSKENTQVDKA